MQPFSHDVTDPAGLALMRKNFPGLFLENLARSSSRLLHVQTIYKPIALLPEINAGANALLHPLN
jgi:hypothetical protein